MLARYLTLENLAIALVAVAALGLLVGYLFARLRWATKYAGCQAENERLAREKGFLQQQIAQAEETRRETVRMLQASYDEAKAAMAERLHDQETHWKEQQQAALDQFKAISTQVLTDNTHHLKSSNQEQMAALLTPLRQQIEGLGKAVQQTNTTNAGNKATLEELIRQMLDQTKRLDAEATNLTKALKGDNKKQGNWGELVLERMLEESGLRKNEEYYLQQTYATEEGRAARPDVVVRFPDNRCVIIDSKVSLTNYAAYVAAENEDERGIQLEAHIASVRKHINELSEKNYADTVKESVGYVLMFMPNEAAYIAAVQAHPELPLEGYSKGILLISPTNLLMALQLAHNLWQKERQANSMQAIVDQATGIYDQCYRLTESFDRMGKSLQSAQKAYEEAMGRFTSKRGCLIHRVEKLRTMGINTTKRLKITEEEPEELLTED